MSDHASNPDQLMARALGVCWHSPTSDRWPCLTAPSPPPPSGELLHRLCEDAVADYQVAMVGPRMVSGLPEYQTMPAEERAEWQRTVLAIAAGTFQPRASCTSEQRRAWEAVEDGVRATLAAASSPPPHGGEALRRCCMGLEYTQGTCGDECPAAPSEPPALPMSEAHKQALRDQVLNARVEFHPEPPAADSPTPGTDPGPGLRGCCWDGSHPGERCPAAPSPVGTTEPPAELDCCGGSYDQTGEAHYTDCRATELPAEAQQDDERWPDAVLIEGDWVSPRKEAHARDLTKSWADAAKDAGCPDRFVARMRTFVELHDRLHTASVALAARPSADAETLRERTADLLAPHDGYHVDGDGWTVCLCGHVAEGDDDDGSHARHLADVLAARDAR